MILSSWIHRKSTRSSALESVRRILQKLERYLRFLNEREPGAEREDEPRRTDAHRAGAEQVEKDVGPLPPLPRKKGETMNSIEIERRLGRRCGCARRGSNLKASVSWVYKRWSGVSALCCIGGLLRFDARRETFGFGRAGTRG